MYYKAVRNEDLDYHENDRPYSTEIIVTDKDGNYLESTGDWNYFTTEGEAESYCKGFNDSRHFK